VGCWMPWIEGVEARLRDAERWLDTTADVRARPGAPSAEMVVVDEEEFRRLPGAITVLRAGRSLALGDVPGTVAYARRALDLLPEDDHLWRGAAAAVLGLASWTSGDLEAAHRSYADGMAILQRAGYISDAVGGAMTSADIRIAQGRLREAMGQAPAGVKGDPTTRETTVAGVYVAGDAGNAVQSALLAAASGANAAFFVNHSLAADEVAAISMGAI
jgi:LuxR family maltose regulon positive regulatory protein